MLGALVAPLLRSLCARRAARFTHALDHAAQAQRDVLQRILRAAAVTEYAREHGLEAGDSVDAFRRKLPISDYARLQPWIQRQRTHRLAAITPGRLRCFEPTSGSSGAAKAIPYNDALLRSFRSLFAIWVHDLLSHRLRPRSGRTFISVSPGFGADRGLADDRDYLGAAMRAMVGRFLLTPSQLAPAASTEEFRRQLAVTLAGCSDLEIVSVWNPGYLLLVMDFIESRDAAMMRALPPQRRRVLENEAQPWTVLWPQLQLVSCWNAAAAATPARTLALRLPQAQLQGKGLLATEAPISLPLHAANGCVPLLDEVFLEFADDDGNCHLLHELAADRSYSVIVTQAGGLLRYRIGDRVRVSRYYRQAPVLEFIGREASVVDLVGEKLHEAFVASVFANLIDTATFAMLLPVLPAHAVPYYECLTDVADADFARHLDAALCQAMRYGEARALGQLACVHVRARPDMRRCVHDFYTARGIAPGDIKERSLLTDLDTAQQLRAVLEPGQSANRRSGSPA